MARTPAERGYHQVMLSKEAYAALTAHKGSDSYSRAVLSLLATAEQVSDGRPSKEWLEAAFRTCKVTEKPARERWYRAADIPLDDE